MENSRDGCETRTEVEKDEDIYTAAVRQRERNDARGNGGREEKKKCRKRRAGEMRKTRGERVGREGRKHRKKSKERESYSRKIECKRKKG